MVLQASVVDTRTGKVVEGEGGRKVLVHPSSSVAAVRRDPNEGADASGLDKAEGARKRGGNKANEKKKVEHQVTRKVENGWDVLSNNGVNFAMAASVSVAAMAITCVQWGVSVSSLIQNIMS